MSNESGVSKKVSGERLGLADEAALQAGPCPVPGAGAAAVSSDAVPASVSPCPICIDRMAYVADMLEELRQMAEREARPTLAGLLALAVAEARQPPR